MFDTLNRLRPDETPEEQPILSLQELNEQSRTRTPNVAEGEEEPLLLGGDSTPEMEAELKEQFNISDEIYDIAVKEAGETPKPVITKPVEVEDVFAQESSIIPDSNVSVSDLLDEAAFRETQAVSNQATAFGKMGDSVYGVSGTTASIVRNSAMVGAASAQRRYFRSRGCW